MNAVQQNERKRPISVTDYHRMVEVGILAPQERIELIDGEIMNMSPIGSAHSGIVDHLTYLLVQAVGRRAIVRVQNPVVLSQFSEPEPDFAILKPRDNYYKDAKPSALDVLLLIEVSESSLIYDREIKAPLYARYGIPEVWCFDVANARMSIFCNPQPDGYASESLADLAGEVTPSQLPDVAIDLSTVF